MPYPTSAAPYGGQNPVATPREIEAQVFLRAIRALKSISAVGFKADPARYLRVIQDNRTLWVSLAKDVSLPGNPLDNALKAQIISLSGFVISETTRVIARKTTPERLIEINTMIWRGLTQTSMVAA